MINEIALRIIIIIFNMNINTEPPDSRINSASAVRAQATNEESQE